MIVMIVMIVIIVIIVILVVMMIVVRLVEPDHLGLLRAGRDAQPVVDPISYNTVS